LRDFIFPESAENALENQNIYEKKSNSQFEVSSPKTKKKKNS